MYLISELMCTIPLQSMKSLTTDRSPTEAPSENRTRRRFIWKRHNAYSQRRRRKPRSESARLTAGSYSHGPSVAHSAHLFQRPSEANSEACEQPASLKRTLRRLAPAMTKHMSRTPATYIRRNHSKQTPDFFQLEEDAARARRSAALMQNDPSTLPACSTTASSIETLGV